MLRVNHLSGFNKGLSGGVFPSGLTVWARYKASDLAPGIADGGAVGTWTDKSGNGRDATQSTSARKPLLRYATSGLSGNRYSVEFLGNSTDTHHLFVPSMAALTSGFIAAFLINDTDTNDTDASHARRLWEMGSSTDGYYKYTNTSVGAGIYETFGTTSRKTTGDTSPTSGVLTQWHSYMVASASGAWTSWRNNVQHFNTGTNTVGFSSSPSIGGLPAGGTPSLANKKIAEIVICSAVPNSTDRGLLHRYFLDEYA